ncbi:glycoside hydrolase family 28 protein [Gorillibacterium sp. sgz5001074]|uniref:glycoside hydrolase family 28 protein n=1 Tax=Gorillibacterium sp. sgz5001074 TaxID=3446695 RepID=UPI003F67ED6D
MAIYHITEFGARGDGQTNCSEAIRAAVAACKAKGGGTVYVPAGTYLTGPIAMESHMTLYLEAGAVLKFSDRFDDYPAVFTRWSGYEGYGYHPLVYGHGLEQVAIKGEGILDGQGQAWWEAYRELRYKGVVPESKVRDELVEKNAGLVGSVKSNIVEWGTVFFRPPLIQLLDCKDVVLEGVTFRNSPFWNTHLVYCEHVSIRGVTFRNPYDAPNSDGLDVDSCVDVRISDSHFDVGDDCLCLKAGIDEDGRRVGKATENVTVTNCTMLHGHGGVVFGSETAGGIRHVTISNCIFLGTDRGIRFKTNRARGGGAEDILLQNIFMRDVLCPIAINGFYKHGVDETNPLMTSPDAVPITEATPVIKNISISNITALNCKAAAGFIYGLPERPIENLSLQHIRIEMTDDPNEQGGEPDMVRENLVMAGEGILCKHVRGLELHSVAVATRQGPALILDQVKDAVVDGLRMLRRHAGTPAMRVKSSEEIQSNAEFNVQ